MARVKLPVLDEVSVPRRRTTGLFVSFPPVSMGPGQNEGSQWLEPAIDGPDAHQTEICPAGALPDNREPSAPYLLAESCFHVSMVSSVACMTVGDQAHGSLSSDELRRIAEDKLRHGAEASLAVALSTGKAWQRVLSSGQPTGAIEEAYDLEDNAGNPIDPWCIDGANVVTPQAATAVSARILIASLEELVADASTSQPVIYAGIGAMPFLVGDGGPVYKTGRTFATAAETPVVFPWGARGYNPATGLAPAAGTTWVVMKGQPRISRSGQWPVDQGVVEATVLMGNNKRRFWIEEDFTVGFDRVGFEAAVLLSKA